MFVDSIKTIQTILGRQSHSKCLSHSFVFLLELFQINAYHGKSLLRLCEEKREEQDGTEGGAAAPNKELQTVGQNCDPWQWLATLLMNHHHQTPPASEMGAWEISCCTCPQNKGRQNDLFLHLVQNFIMMLGSAEHFLAFPLCLPLTEARNEGC